MYTMLTIVFGGYLHCINNAYHVWGYLIEYCAVHIIIHSYIGIAIYNNNNSSFLYHHRYFVRRQLKLQE